MGEYIKSWEINSEKEGVEDYKGKHFRYKPLNGTRLKVGLNIPDLGFALLNSDSYLDEVKQVINNYGFNIEGENHIMFYFKEEKQMIAPVKGLIKRVFDKEFPSESLAFKNEKSEICFWHKNRHVKFEVYQKPIE
jgi:hypothetical protein